ncbi:MAG: aldose 1-epimerase family protein [Rhodomicrobium sp.]
MANITIHSSAFSAEIAPLGAELQNLRDAAGRDYLHDGASFWSGRAPLLFPIVGALKDDRHEVAGKAYTLPKHGFARRSRFEVVETSPDRALFRLTDSEATRAAYPYKFQLDAAFSVAGAKLAMAATVTNTDTRPIPVAFGFHPAFAWPLPGAGARLDHAIDFAASEPGPLTRIDAGGLIARELASPVQGRRLALTDDLFVDDALIFLSLNSRSLRFGPADGGSPALNIEFEVMPYLGIWTKPGAPFLCIEPWCGYASPNDFSGPLTEKPGSINLAPGEARVFAMSVELV